MHDRLLLHAVGQVDGDAISEGCWMNVFQNRDYSAHWGQLTWPLLGQRNHEEKASSQDKHGAVG